MIRRTTVPRRRPQPVAAQRPVRRTAAAPQQEQVRRGSAVQQPRAAMPRRMQRPADPQPMNRGARQEVAMQDGSRPMPRRRPMR